MNKFKYKKPEFNYVKNDLIKLCKKRSKIYAKANFRINCSNLTKTQIVNKILQINFNQR